MPKVTIKKISSLAPDEAFNRVSEVLKSDSELKKLDPSYSCQFEPSRLSGVASGKMFKANMQIAKSANGCEVEIIVDLPFALTLAKGLVQRTLEKKLDRALA